MKPPDIADISRSDRAWRPSRGPCPDGAPYGNGLGGVGPPCEGPGLSAPSWHFAQCFHLSVGRGCRSRDAPS